MGFFFCIPTTRNSHFERIVILLRHMFKYFTSRYKFFLREYKSLTKSRCPEIKKKGIILHFQGLTSALNWAAAVEPLALPVCPGCPAAPGTSQDPVWSHTRLLLSQNQEHSEKKKGVAKLPTVLAAFYRVVLVGTDMVRVRVTSTSAGQSNASRPENPWEGFFPSR